jgi:hypothetical protein
MGVVNALLCNGSRGSYQPPRWRIPSQPHMARTSLTSVGSEADSPEPFLRPSRATGHDAEMREVDDPEFGYDAEIFPYTLPHQGIQPTCRTG